LILARDESPGHAIDEQRPKAHQIYWIDKLLESAHMMRECSLLKLNDRKVLFDVFKIVV
jgi:hypothetical protein